MAITSVSVCASTAAATTVGMGQSAPKPPQPDDRALVVKETTTISEGGA